jgi:hypothetical protein
MKVEKFIDFANESFRTGALLHGASCFTLLAKSFSLSFKIGHIKIPLCKIGQIRDVGKLPVRRSAFVVTFFSEMTDFVFWVILPGVFQKIFNFQQKIRVFTSSRIVLKIRDLFLHIKCH